MEIKLVNLIFSTCLQKIEKEFYFSSKFSLHFKDGCIFNRLAVIIIVCLVLKFVFKDFFRNSAVMSLLIMFSTSKIVHMAFFAIITAAEVIPFFYAMVK